jgi:hypothetical protein
VCLMDWDIGLQRAGRLKLADLGAHALEKKCVDEALTARR